MEKKKYTVKEVFDGHAIGSIVELTDAEAKQLLADGKIEAAS